MNRILAVIVGVAILALVGFGVVVFTSTPPVPSQPAVVSSAESAEPPDGDEEVSEAPVTTEEQAAAIARFDAWAKPLRDDGLTVTAQKVSESGETISVGTLAIAGPDETPGWRWTAERASLYDRELFHLQAAGATTFAVTTEAGQEIAWSGRADAIGVAVQRDLRDALSSSLVLRVNGLSLTGEGDAAPMTLSDGQLRILLKGGTGLLAPGTDMAMRLTDLTLPSAAGSTLGSAVKSFTTEFAVDRPITSYSLRQVIDFFTRGQSGIELGTIAVDWGTLHVLGKGSFGLSATGKPRARFEVKASEVLTLLEAVAASGQASAEAVAAESAAMLLELGRTPGEAAVPVVIALEDGAIVLEGAGGDIVLGTLPGQAGTAAGSSP